ncbi:MAG TPA: FBP domain-containing protein [Micromonosporaceae bacterium]
MFPISEAALRESFVNCSKGDRAKLSLPGPLADVDFDQLEFLGWRDPKAPERAYAVSETGSGPVAIVLRAASKSMRSLSRSSMCSICMTVHAASGVALLSAPLAGPAGRAGNSAGIYMCADLQCSRYIRGTLKPDAIVPVAEIVDLNTKIQRVRDRMGAFVQRIVAG